MNRNDLNDLKNATREIYSTFFSTKIKIKLLVEEEIEGVYKEKKRYQRRYTDSIDLVGRVNLSPLAEEIRADLGSTDKVNAIFEIPTIELEDSDLLDNPLSVLRKGLILYNDVEYEILNIVPVTHVDEIFLFYKFEVRSLNG